MTPPVDLDLATDAELAERFGMDGAEARVAVARVRASRVAQGLPPQLGDMTRTMRILARSGLEDVLSTSGAGVSPHVESSASRLVARGAESSSPRGPENVAHGQVAPGLDAESQKRRAS